jgi:hypothetical protein
VTTKVAALLPCVVVALNYLYQSVLEAVSVDGIPSNGVIFNVQSYVQEIYK